MTFWNVSTMIKYTENIHGISNKMSISYISNFYNINILIHLRTLPFPWGNEDTQKILDTLKKYKINVTFFMTGGWVESYPDDVKAIQKAGHDLGNHSENHKHMPQLDTTGMCDELNKVTEKVKNLTGTTMCLFRPPYGDYDNNLIIQAKNCGYYTIQWNVDNDHTNGRKLNLPFDIYFVIINIYSFYVILNHFFLLIKRKFFERYWFYFFCLALFCKNLVNRIFLFI